MERLLGKEKLDTLTAIHPYMIALQNLSMLSVTTVVFRYPRFTPDGKSVAGVMPYSMDSLGLKFDPGTTLIFTPDDRLTRLLNGAARDTSSTQVIAANRDKLLAMRFDPGRFPRATVSLDAVVLSDGTVIGPDRDRLIERELRKSEGENSILSKMKDASLSEADALQWLTDESQRPYKNPSFDPFTRLPDFEAFYKADFARTVLKYANQYGRAFTVQWIQDIIADKAALPQLHHVKE
ncbi:MAG: hypothetical protein LAP87_12025 [Acidobacteriia bacterium]|nr:hypothetical protein [Terriglobia bacterium]